MTTAVLKQPLRQRHRGFESLSLRQFELGRPVREGEGLPVHHHWGKYDWMTRQPDLRPTDPEGRLHVLDTQRLLPKTSGVINARSFPAALREIGFNGPVIVEPFNADVRALPPR